MKFLAALAVLFVAASALPLGPDHPLVTEGNKIFKRTCGTLTGIERKICEDACIAVCDVASAGIAADVCSSACKAGPL